MSDSWITGFCCGILVAGILYWLRILQMQRAYSEAAAEALAGLAEARRNLDDMRDVNQRRYVELRKTLGLPPQELQ